MLYLYPIQEAAASEIDDEDLTKLGFDLLPPESVVFGSNVLGRGGMGVVVDGQLRLPGRAPIEVKHKHKHTRFPL